MNSEKACDAKRLENGATIKVAVSMLGGFRLSVNGVSIGNNDWRLSKAAGLVKLLALSPDRRRHREEFIEALWPALSPEAGSNNLRQALYVARQTLQIASLSGDKILVREGEFIAFAPEVMLWTDVDAFERAAAGARDSSALEHYEQAIELYAGELLPDDRFEDWAIVRREALTSMVLKLLVRAAQLAEESGREPLAVHYNEQIVSIDPLDEEAHARLMRIYARTSRRSEALRQYRKMELLLRSELHVSPVAATRDLYADILARRYPTQVREIGELLVPDTLPSLDAQPRYVNSFIGRQSSMDALAGFFESNRLVTLIGIGGVGKTRLALALVDEIEDRFERGARIVDLSPLNDPALVWPRIRSALGLAEGSNTVQAEELRRICNQALLLLIDNCEHVLESVRKVADRLLAAGDGLRILATSREPLHLSDEAVWTVDPLGLPDAAGEPSLAAIRKSEAVGLFLDRLHLRYPNFTLSAASAPYVLEICRQMEGIPLPIEMAAALAATLSLPDLPRRQEHAMVLYRNRAAKSDARHDTLRAMLDWSFDLLSSREQLVFVSLSVFPGAWTLDAAEAVASGGDLAGGEIAAILSALVDKSLIVRQGDPLTATYRYLTPVRYYAIEQLDRSAGANEVRRRHAEYFLALAEAVVPQLRGPNQAAATEQLERERDNMRGALAWAIGADPSLGLQLAVALGRFWYLRGYLEEGRNTLQATLEAARTAADRLRAEALYHLGILSDEAGDHEQAAANLLQALDLFQVLGDQSRCAATLNSLGVVARARGDLDAARQMLEESLAIRRKEGDPRVIISTVGNLALIEWSRGDLDRAQPLLEETRELAVQTDDEWSIAMANSHLGRIAWQRQAYTTSLRLFRDSLVLARKLADTGLILEGVEGIAAALGQMQAPLCAAGLWGAADAIREGLNLPIPDPELPLFERMVADARAHLDDETFKAAWDAGRESTIEKVVGQALDAAEFHMHVPPEDAMEALTARQRDIAVLLTHDLTNQEIADKLGIARRTVDTHVSNILQRLGVASRSEIADLIGDS